MLNLSFEEIERNSDKIEEIATGCTYNCMHATYPVSSPLSCRCHFNEQVGSEYEWDEFLEIKAGSLQY